MAAERLVPDASGTVTGHLDPTPLSETLGLGKLGSLFGLARRDASDAPLARVLCVASGKGGTGKSILSSNLAVLRARSGERVLLVDFDAGLANAHLLLGLAPKHDLSHVLQGQVSAEEALVSQWGDPPPQKFIEHVSQ